ncbi:unnamed protein product [Lampetra planeri]
MARDIEGWRDNLGTPSSSRGSAAESVGPARPLLLVSWVVAQLSEAPTAVSVSIPKAPPALPCPLAGEQTQGLRGFCAAAPVASLSGRGPLRTWAQRGPCMA